jgi:hypothetical protein
MIITRIVFLTVTLLSTASIYAQSNRIPNTALRVTVQQKEEGKLDSGLHLLELHCWDGACSLSSVSLNQCSDSGSGKKAFYPKVQHSTTHDGTLKVWNEGTTLVVQETGSDIGGDYTNNLRFEYEPPGEGRIASRLVGFNGGFVKNSVLLKKILTVQYVPLPRLSQVVSLDCGILLPGVNK